MRVWFINRFYWPDEPATAQLLGDLAEALAARGWPISVIASHPGDAQTPTGEIRNGVKVYRRRGPRWGRTAVGGKFAAYLFFLLGAGWQTLLSLRRGDVVVAMTDPPLLGVVLWPIAALRRARLIHWAQDIYPEVAMALAARPMVRWALGLLRGPRNFTWRHSAGCVVLGRDMAELASRQRIPPGQVTIISNWAPQGLAPPPAAEVLALREKWHLAGKFVVAYSGNLGRVHDLEPVLAVAGVLRATPEIVFAFVGAGAQRETLEALVAARQLTNVRFFPPQPRDLLGATLAMGDVHLVTLRPGCEALVFPSKLYGIAAVGRPAVFIGPRDCELARMIEDQQIGFAFAPHETSAAADALRQLHDSPAMREQVGRAAAHFAASAGGSRAAVEKWHALLSRGAGPGATPTEPMGQPG